MKNVVKIERKDKNRLDKQEKKAHYKARKLRKTKRYQWSA